MMRRKGFTLIEILIAVALFGIAGTIATVILSDVVKLEKRSEIHSTIYRDATVLMQQIVNEVKKGTVDYEEYFSIHVVQAENDNNGGEVFHGTNHGVYASRFYDPGLTQNDVPEATNPEHLGIECAYPQWETSLDECEIIYTPSFDTNTGQNPYRGSDREAASANAFCDGNTGLCGDPGIVDELYLIDESGTRKTVIAAHNFDGVERVGIVRMTGIDFDQNGIVDIFSCDEGFDCEFLGEEGGPGGDIIPYLDGDDEEISLPRKGTSKAFVPLSPARAQVVDLTFIIRPLEDPYRAYAERDMQQHPSVTIILTLGLSDSAAIDYPGDFAPITVQTTVSAGSRERIDSYPPVTEFRGSGDVSWIRDLLN